MAFPRFARLLLKLAINSESLTILTNLLQYLDTNKLYGESLMQILPTETLVWVNPKDFNLYNYSCNRALGGFPSRADFDYPDDLPKLHNNFPLAGEKNKIDWRNVVVISIVNQRRW